MGSEVGNCELGVLTVMRTTVFSLSNSLRPSPILLNATGCNGTEMATSVFCVLGKAARGILRIRKHWFLYMVEHPCSPDVDLMGLLESVPAHSPVQNQGKPCQALRLKKEDRIW